MHSLPETHTCCIAQVLRVEEGPPPTADVTPPPPPPSSAGERNAPTPGPRPATGPTQQAAPTAVHSSTAPAIASAPIPTPAPAPVPPAPTTASSDPAPAGAAKQENTAEEPVGTPINHGTSRHSSPSDLFEDVTSALVAGQSSETMVTEVMLMGCEPEQVMAACEPGSTTLKARLYL